MCVYLQVRNNKATSGSQVDSKWMTSVSLVSHKYITHLSQGSNNKATKGSQVGGKLVTSVSLVSHKYITYLSQVSNSKATKRCCDSKVANTNWLIPLVA